MEAFDPATVFSSIDTGGRYAYGNQPVVAEWNLARLAEALLPLLHDDQDQAVALAVEALGAFRRQYERRLVGRHAGQARPARRPRRGGGSPLVDELLALLRDEPRRLHVVLPRASARPPRGDAEPARGLFLDLAGVRRLAGAAGARSARTPTRWTGSTRSTSRATTSSRRPSTAATDGDLEPFERLLDAVASPTTSGRPRALRRPRPGGLRRVPDLLRHLSPSAGDTQPSVSRCPSG